MPDEHLKVVELDPQEFFLLANLLFAGRWCWLTPDELSLLNTIRAEKGLPPVVATNRVSAAAPSAGDAAKER